MKTKRELLEDKLRPIIKKLIKEDNPNKDKIQLINNALKSNGFSYGAGANIHLSNGGRMDTPYQRSNENAIAVIVDFKKPYISVDILNKFKIDTQCKEIYFSNRGGTWQLNLQY